ncbi:MAG: DegT/DnrJ/EryC1/StrS family aminotransferase [Dokdonella sp.]
MPIGIAVPFLDLGAAYAELRGPLDEASARVLASGRFILGEEVEAFESEFARYCGARHCIGVANGLDALHLILRAYAIGAGDEVIVPSNTFIATWLAVTHAGARPVPVEPTPGTYNLDANRIEAAITPRTRAVIAVHLYGQCADMTAISDVCRRHSLRLIEDAAQAHGASWNTKCAGALANAAAFSFYPGKNLGAFGDGGAVTTSDSELAERVQVLGNYGSAIKYEHRYAGFNSRLDEMQAAFLRVKLRVLDTWNERRRRVAAKYVACLPTDVLQLPQVAGNGRPVWHLFVVRTANRSALQRFLADHGVQTLIHYPTPPHLQGAYSSMRYREGDFPIAESMHREVLSLPIGPHLTLEQIDTVVDACRAARFAGAVQ